MSSRSPIARPESLVGSAPQLLRPHEGSAVTGRSINGSAVDRGRAEVRAAPRVGGVVGGGAEHQSTSESEGSEQLVCPHGSLLPVGFVVFLMADSAALVAQGSCLELSDGKRSDPCAGLYEATLRQGRRDGPARLFCLDKRVLAQKAEEVFLYRNTYKGFLGLNVRAADRRALSAVRWTPAPSK